MILGIILFSLDHSAHHDVILSQTMCLAQRYRLAVYPTQYPAHESTVDILVFQGINRTGCTIESHSTAASIEHRLFADIGSHSVKRHNIAAGSNPQRQIGIAELPEISYLQHALMRELRFAGMSGIIHD